MSWKPAWTWWWMGGTGPRLRCSQKRLKAPKTAASVVVESNAATRNRRYRVDVSAPRSMLCTDANRSLPDAWIDGDSLMRPARCESRAVASSRPGARPELASARLFHGPPVERPKERAHE